MLRGVYIHLQKFLVFLQVEPVSAFFIKYYYN